jgi:hypothetical protein
LGAPPPMHPHANLPSKLNSSRHLSSTTVVTTSIPNLSL